jgi:hypothetical protein
VGQKIDLGFDVDTLRIIDCDEDEDTNGNNYSSNSSSNAIVNALKRNSTAKEDPNDGDNAPKIKADTNSTLLKQFINNIE